MASVLKTLLDKLSLRITENKSDITTIEQNVTQLTTDLSTVQTEVETARGGKTNLNIRLDGMDSKIETNTADTAEALARITTAESDIIELGTELNETNSTLTSVNTQVNTAKGSYASLDIRIAASGFTGFGRVLNNTSKQSWVALTTGVHYYTANGVETTSDLAVYQIQKLYTIPVLVTVAIANILTVTSSDLLPTSIPFINIEDVLYSVYAIQLPYITLINNTVVQNSYVDSPVVFAPDSESITMSLIGNLGNMGSTESSSNYKAYLPVLRPATSPGTVFKFLSTKIDPDTNTVQYSTFNSQVTIPL